MLDDKTISDALAYQMPTGKKGNKYSSRLKINVARYRRDPGFLEELAILAMAVRVAVHAVPKPALVECPGYDGVCHNCDTCTCHEYY